MSNAFSVPIQAYVDAQAKLIPLHRWNAKHDGKEAGKRPLHNDWRNRTYDAGRCAEIFGTKGVNIGFPIPANTIVADYDPRRDSNGQEWNRFCGQFGIEERDYPKVITGSGGVHLYMRKPADLATVEALDDFPSIEIKATGRQVVCAGSRHPNGKFYEWAEGHPPLKEVAEAPAMLLGAIRRPETTGEAAGSGVASEDQIAKALTGLDVTGFRDEAKWRRLMMACHHASGGAARDAFVEWSVGDPQYVNDSEIIGRRWDSLSEKPGAITVRTLNKFLTDAGHSEATIAEDASADFKSEDDSGSSAELAPIEKRGIKLNRYAVAADTFTNALAAVDKAKINPCWDELKQNVQLRAAQLPWPDHYGRMLNDHVLRLVRILLAQQFQGVAYEPGAQHVFDALAGIAYQNKFNPVLDYLNGLTWDGTKRVEMLFPRYFDCGDDDYTRGVSVAFAVGAVRRMRKPGCKFDTTPIIKGRQGIGKSKGIQTLFGREWTSDTDLGNLRDKDAALKLRGIWCHEFAELQTLSRAESGQLKAFVSSATDRQRDPYGRVVEEQPRRSVFIGTCNESGYLKDSTGARRFWPLDSAGPIDVDRIARDRDQLWAEAAAMDARGVSDVLPERLWPIAGQRQADQTSNDPWADTLAYFLSERAQAAALYDTFGVESGDDDIAPLPANRVHTSELFGALGINAAEQTKDKGQRVRTVMEAVLGWHHKRGVRVLDRTGAGYVKA